MASSHALASTGQPTLGVSTGGASRHNLWTRNPSGLPTQRVPGRRNTGPRVAHANFLAGGVRQCKQLRAMRQAEARECEAQARDSEEDGDGEWMDDEREVGMVGGLDDRMDEGQETVNSGRVGGNNGFNNEGDINMGGATGAWLVQTPASYGITPMGNTSSNPKKPSLLPGDIISRMGSQHSLEILDSQDVKDRLQEVLNGGLSSTEGLCRNDTSVVDLAKRYMAHKEHEAVHHFISMLTAIQLETKYKW